MRGLILKDVAKSFGTVPVLQNINLSIQTGAFVCLLGASGCGKTTLLRTIAGFEDLAAGDIRLDGQSLNGVPPISATSAWCSKALRCFLI